MQRRMVPIADLDRPGLGVIRVYMVPMDRLPAGADGVAE